MRDGGMCVSRVIAVGVASGTQVVIGVGTVAAAPASPNDTSVRRLFSTARRLLWALVTFPLVCFKELLCCVAQCFLPDSVLYGARQHTVPKAAIARRRRGDTSGGRAAETTPPSSGNGPSIRPLPWAVTVDDLNNFLTGEKMCIAAACSFFLLESVALGFIHLRRGSHCDNWFASVTCVPTDLIFLTVAANVVYATVLMGKSKSHPFVGLGSLRCTCCCEKDETPGVGPLQPEVGEEIVAPKGGDDRIVVQQLLRAGVVLSCALDSSVEGVALLTTADQRRRNDRHMRARSSPHHQPDHQHTFTIDVLGNSASGPEHGPVGGSAISFSSSSTERLLDQYIVVPREALFGQGTAVPSQWEAAVQHHFARHVSPPNIPEQGVVVPSWMWCGYCKHVKPLRAKHCHTCGRCSREQDHHCPWIGSCVGATNLARFLALVSCMMLGIGRGVVELIVVSQWGKIASHAHQMEIQAILLMGGMLTFLLVSFPLGMTVVALTAGRTSYEVFRETPYERLLTMRDRIRKMSHNNSTCSVISPSPPWPIIVIARWYTFLWHALMGAPSDTCDVVGSCALCKRINTPVRRLLGSSSRNRFLEFLIAAFRRTTTVFVAPWLRRAHSALIGEEAKEASLDGLLRDLEAYLAANPQHNGNDAPPPLYSC